MVRTTRRRWSIRLIVAGAVLMVAASGATALTAWAQSGPTSYSSFFTGVDTSAVRPDPDDRPVELGLRFNSTVDGKIDAVRFLKVPGDPGPHRVSVWSASGTKLATAMSSNESASGWQEVKLAPAVGVSANRTYTISYHTNRYVASTGYFRSPVKSGPLTAAGPANGVYAYGADGYPSQTWRSSNYWVDLVFETGSSAGNPGPAQRTGYRTERRTDHGSGTVRAALLPGHAGQHRPHHRAGPGRYQPRSAAGAVGGWPVVLRPVRLDQGVDRPELSSRSACGRSR